MDRFYYYRLRDNRLIEVRFDGRESPLQFSEEELFQNPINRFDTVDGESFIVAKPPHDDMPSIGLITNWQTRLSR